MRKVKTKPRLGGEGKWEFEIGEEYSRLASGHREPQALMESRSNVSQACSMGWGGEVWVDCARSQHHLVAALPRSHLPYISGVAQQQDNSLAC